jgi:sugar phosphate isomerase/epimerase
MEPEEKTRSMTMTKKNPLILASILLIASLPALAALQAQAPDKSIPASVQQAVAAADYAAVRIKEFPIAVQCWTYRNYSFLETLDKVKALGIKNIQAFPGQLLGKAIPKAVFGPDMTDDELKAVRAAAESAGIRIVGFGVCEIGTTEKEMRKIFDFAAKMEIPTIVCEPPADDYALLGKLAEEYGIRVAVHNHPAPAKYAYPALLVKNLAGQNRLLGSCADPGHWMRGGLKPVECLRYLEGRILDVHLKDRSDFGTKKVADTAVGDGKAGLRDILAELTLQDYDGYLTFEYENEKEAATPEPAIMKSLANIKALTYYAGYEQVFRRGWGGYEKYGWNHYGPGYFEVDPATGVLKGNGGMGLLWYSVRTYRDFVLECDFKCASKDTNSGIFVRVPGVPSSNDYIYHSLEIQIYDAGEGIHATGAAYDIKAAASGASLPPGEWNHFKIIFKGGRLTVDLNGKTILDWDAVPGGKVKDIAREGYIGFQNHDSVAPIYFRNIFIKEI